ncbi:MAG: hypothetical protein M3410_09280 [Acidobacteriota bacterium]|nr:hypothetical protein [Acidobacteriota bacterium]
MTSYSQRYAAEVFGKHYAQVLAGGEAVDRYEETAVFGRILAFSEIFRIAQWFENVQWFP